MPAASTTDAPEAVPASDGAETPAEPPVVETASKPDPVPDDADSTPRADPRALHGSQVASSQWLPITIGGGLGLIVGVVVGQAVDPTQGPVIGPIVGGLLGGLAGGAGGAWLIRGLRGEDTRFAGALTGLAIGGGFGASLYAHTESTFGKVAAIVLFPAAGALVGHRLAFVIGGLGSESRPRVAIAPTGAPILTEGRGATGFFVGVNGVIF